MKNTQKVVSEMTGIPQSTISYVSRGLRELPKIYTTTMRNFYQRDAYATLKETGFSATQANRFKWYVPETVLDVTEIITDKVNSMAVGYVGHKTEGIGGEFTQEQLRGFFDEGVEKVKEGLRKSYKTFEQWDNYF